MPVEKFEIISGDYGELNQYGRIERARLTVTCIAGGDPFTEPGVPQLFSPLVAWSSTTTVRSLKRVKHITRSSTAGGFDRYIIEIEATNEPLKRWAGHHAVFTVNVPTFDARKVFYRTASGAMESRNEWVRQDLQILTNLVVLEREVEIERISPQQFIQIGEQVGKIHTFFGRPWKMEPAIYNDVGADRTLIQYAWTTDPGTGPLVDDQQNSDYIAPDFTRGPFQDYRVRPAEAIGGRPFIFPRELYPPGSEYIEPDGYQTLPGTPIG